MPLELPPQPVPSAAAAAPAQCCGTVAVAVLVLAVPTAAGGGAEQGGGKLVEGPLSGPLFFSEGNATAPGQATGSLRLGAATARRGQRAGTETVLGGVSPDEAGGQRGVQ